MHSLNMGSARYSGFGGSQERGFADAEPGTVTTEVTIAENQRTEWVFELSKMFRRY